MLDSKADLEIYIKLCIHNHQEMVPNVPLELKHFLHLIVTPKLYTYSFVIKISKPQF